MCMFVHVRIVIFVVWDVALETTVNAPERVFVHASVEV